MNRDNYIYFLNKIRESIYKDCNILCYCLMPNHFHFLLHIPEQFNALEFSKNFRICLSSYTRAVNVQKKRVGSLFQQHTKFKSLTDYERKYGYTLACFNYIHQNPFVSKLVSKMEDWEFSSFPDYIGKRNGTMCNQELAFELIYLPVNKDKFYKMSYEMVNPEKVKMII